ncbi:CYFA0S19e01288g1_1 [Cyberlindnera fabianii]|uniref:ATP-dependent DNA helicase II subunit 1 n=1 Tax=Cyberlindnera fabianii TaxID=36022 RepID=A0A061B6V1_CYBFA|nr:CYFA0S19e01288g1_1 [Cyberlindnera fabianii]
MSTQVEEALKPVNQYELHEGIIFAIELTDSLLATDPRTGRSSMEIILEALHEAMAHSAITLPNTGYGCYLFNSKNESNGSKKGVQTLFALRDLNPKDMKIIYEIIEENRKSNDPDRPYLPLQERFSPGEGSRGDNNPLYEMLSTIHEEFLIKKEFQKVYTIKKIFLFTDNDTPVDTKEKKDFIRTICGDLDENQVTILPFFLNNKGKIFDDSIYSEVMRLHDDLDDNDDEEAPLFDGPSTKPIDVKDINERITRRKEIKRILFQCPLLFSDELVIGVKGYAVYNHEVPSKTKFLFVSEKGRKNVHSRVRYIDKETSGEFEKIERVYTIGNGNDDYIRLNLEQEAQIHKYDDNYDVFLKLIGFKDEKSGVKLHYNSTRSSFVVPDEDSYTGSTRTMSALFQSLKKTGKVAIMFGKLRKSGTPTMYALQPTKRKLFSESKAYFPEGFFLIRLPYFDDIRQFPAQHEDMALNPSPRFKAKTKLILRELMMGMPEYSPSDYRNPTLQQHYRTLHDMLMQVDRDHTDLRAEQIANDDTLKRLEEVRMAIMEENSSLANHLKDWKNMYLEGQEL